MAGFNRFGGGGLGSLYTGMNSLQQPSAMNRRDDRFDNRRNSRDFERRERDFGRRDPSPRRRRYSPDPPYSGLRGNRQDNRGGLGSYSMDDLGRDSFARNRGQSSSDRDLMRDGHNMRPPNRGGDGILGAKPGDMPRDLTPNTSSGFTSQIAQQQQQLMAMVQTQSLLAAIQAQASAAAKRSGPGMQPPSLMQGVRMQDNRGRMGDRQNRRRRMSPPRGMQRNMNHRARRTQQFRSNSQGNRSNYPQRRDYDRDRKRVSESSQKSENNEPVEEPYVEDTLDDEEEEEEKEEPKEETVSEENKEVTKKTEADIVEKSEEIKPENQTEDQEYQSETNLAGQNVSNLVKSLYDNSRRKYVCKVCKIMCTKESCFRQHLYGRRHIKTWLESRGQSFEAEMFKRASEEAAKSLAAKEQAKKPKEKDQKTPEESSEEKQESKEKEEEQSVKVKREQESSVSASTSEEETTVKEEEPTEVKKEKSPAESQKPTETAKEDKKTSLKVKEEKIPVKEETFEAKYSCDTRKEAMKEGEFITISSITEARVRLRGFDKGVNTQGCEFVKAVSGFNCRLCRIFILNGNDVMKHVEGKKHKAKYRRYISEHPKYESNQVLRNKELSETLSEREGEEVLLYEVTETEEPKRPYRYGSGETLNVEVTKYVIAEDELDDSMLDESHDELLREDTNTTASSEKKEDMEDDITDDNNRDDEDVESLEINEQRLLGEDTLEEKYDPDIGNKEDEPIAEQNETNITETKEDPNTSVDSLTESQEDEDEEPAEKKAKLITPAVRRGRRGARGGTQARGRGRGRGTKRTTRQKASPKPEVPSSEEQHDDDFMDGFQVIDEVADDE